MDPRGIDVLISISDVTLSDNRRAREGIAHVGVETVGSRRSSEKPPRCGSPAPFLRWKHEMTREPTDDWLLSRWHDGDVLAFRELVRRHQGTLLNYARFLPTGPELAEDVVQETFLRFARRPPELPPETEGNERLAQVHLVSWLIRVTRNCAMEMIRSDARRERRERLVSPQEAVAGGQSNVEQADTRRAVEEGISRLPDAQREVLVLRLLGDRSYKEIASITGRKPGTVAWLISEGLKSLSRTLTPSLEREPAVRIAPVRGDVS